MSCSETHGFLDTPGFVSTCFHCLTILEIPIHIFVGYLILFKTPKRMNSVKWYLFNVHFWSAILDITLSLLIIPYMLFPAAAGYSFGIFMWLGVDPAIQITVLVVEIGMVVLSIMVLFENRYTFLTTTAKFWERARKLFIGCLYVVACTYFIPYMFMVPDQSTVIPNVLEKISTLRCFYSGPIFVLTTEVGPAIWTSLAKLLGEFAIIVIFVALTFRSVLSQSKKTVTSKLTLSLQTKMFVSITIQTAIPIAVIMLPVIYCGYTLSQGYYNQALNNIAFLIISTHGLISTVAMSLIHEPYRIEILRLKNLGTRQQRASVATMRNSLHLERL